MYLFWSICMHCNISNGVIAEQADGNLECYQDQVLHPPIHIPKHRMNPITRALHSSDQN